MSTGFLESGRVQQKQRTHAALVDAARELLAEGRTPTVEDAAEAASVSRTTAYRYFPNQAALLAAAHPEIEAASLLTTDTDDPVARVDDVVGALGQILVDGERQQRAALRLALELEPEQRRERVPLRQGRAIAWIREALEPAAVQLGDDAVDALTLAVRSATGIEALVWLTDVAGLDRDHARALMRWSARAVTRAALAGDPPPPVRP
ncbi:MAG TPA: helix-turn-helix domain-containing protein [Acidimicrobiales bacterium]|nr:helix-turn-helix domain-containing protein [Acidimicrobiales bacterium]